MGSDFGQRVAAVDPGLLRLEDLRTLQVNLGNRCNQSCEHCHVGAGPNGEKLMRRGVMEAIVAFVKHRSGLCVDVTGGCPELNPDFRFFLEAVKAYAGQLMVRTNLTVLLEAGMEWVGRWYSDNRVCLVASLPCYSQENVDGQRGEGVFGRSIEALRMLNALGYGRDGLELNLVYNPGGGVLPGPQEELEAAYKEELATTYGIAFSHLFTITNAPIGRFRKHLEDAGAFERYMALLRQSFNAGAVGSIMCRSLISVGYQGMLYNCDFNQALSLPLRNGDGHPATIEQLEDLLAGEVPIVTQDHCFCCTAGAGSSCTGSLV